MQQALIWDLPVRIAHWGLVLAFIGAYVTNKLGVNYFKYHAWCGYAVIVLVVFRIAWGFVGTHHARFANFIRGPVTTTRYAWNWLQGRESGHAGHNPLGAWMIVVLLLALLAQAMLGLFANDDIFNFGPLYGYVSNELSLELTSLHRRVFNWIAIAALVHVAAVLVHVLFKKEPLIRAMFNGRKHVRDVRVPDVQSSRLKLAVVLLVAISITLGWLILSAPPEVTATFD